MNIHKAPKVPTPDEIDNPHRDLENKRDAVLEILVDGLKQPNRKAEQPIHTGNLDKQVQEAVIEALEEQGWSVTVEKIGMGGGLWWYISRA